MRKIHFINICVRLKSTKTQIDSKIKKKVCTKNIKRIKFHQTNLTSTSNGNDHAALNSASDILPLTPEWQGVWESYYGKSAKTLNESDINTRILKKFESGKNINSNIDSKNVKINNTDIQKTTLLHQYDTQKLKNLDNDMEKDIRVNEVNVQMLPKSLHEQLFKKNDISQRCFSEEEIKNVKKNLAIYGINVEEASRVQNINLKLPVLEGKDIEEHFYNIGKAQVKPYLKIINEIINDIPEMPKQWLFKEGWTRYTADGKTESVDHPLEDGIIFDVEVCVQQGPLPTLATAVSSKAWYGWVSNSLVQGISQTFHTQKFMPNMLIPMESNNKEYGQKLNQYQKKPKIIVGHNVSYDRSRIKEQYWLNCTGTRFLDTMSLHICVSGINTYQRSLLMSQKTDIEKDIWKSNTSLNNLAEVHKLYCGYEISKELRNIFVEGTIEDVRNNFNMLMHYCASDAVATHNVLRNIFPLFQERFPHPVTLAGMLELGSAYLPVNSNWQKYLEESESTFDDLNYELKSMLGKRADAALELMRNKKYKEDLWMWDQDWSTQKIKMKKEVKAKLSDVETGVQKDINQMDDKKYLSDDVEEEKDPLVKEFAYLEKTKHLLPARMPHMPGYPAWYRKLCPKRNEKDWAPGPQKISTAMRVVPKLLNLTWEKYPLHYIKEYGWGILVPHTDDPDIETKLPLKNLIAHCPLPISTKYRNVCDDAMITLNTDVQNELHKTEFWRFKKKQNDSETEWSKFYKGTAVWCNIDIDNCCYFFKLPHKNGANYNVGNPLGKDFLNKFSENVLASSDASAAEVLQKARILPYWRNNRDRIMSQLVVWLDSQSLPSNIKLKKYVSYGAIIPQVVVSGTLTRRAVEPTWMTASNAHIERIGSELRCMVQAPPGYNIVGADVDSQELWIASIIGDAHYKGIHGATPFGWMTLIGTKSNGTDMHSVTANAIGISRDHAKIINYARIYGAGQKFAEQLLKQFNPSMTDVEATDKSRKMLTLTKGKKVFRLKPEFINNYLEDKPYTSYQAYQVAKLHGKTLQDMFQKNEWVDGSESAMFNRLEEIAGSKHPVTPFLTARLSRALELTIDNDTFLPTKINWVVQSGAVDFLHLMLVSMRWLMKDNARFCLSFHDEVRYLVPSRYKYNAALAMHVTNLMTRAFCASRLNMKDLPMSVAFFTAVEVDTVLRKESTHDCKTPSNPHGLQNGYDIPLGESLDVRAAIEKSGGSLGWWHDTRNRKLEPNADESTVN